MPDDPLDALSDLFVAPKTSDPRDRVHAAASRIGVSPDIADDYLNLTGKAESGNRQFTNSGTVLTGPPTRTGSKARGMGQVMPDRPGGMTRTINGRSYNLANPDENVEAGLKLFSAGGSDPVGRRLEYFGGAKARQHYERTGRIPSGGDGYTTFNQYVSKSLPGGPPQRRTQSGPLSSISDLLTDSPQTERPAPPGNLSELASTAAGMNPATESPDTNLPASPDAPVTQPAPVQRQVSAADREWHAAVTPEEYGKLTRKQRRQLDAVTAQQVAEDERKRAAGQTEFTKDVGYQNAVRRAVGLPHVGMDPGFAFNGGPKPIEVKPRPFTYGQDTDAVERQARQSVISRSGGQENIDRIKRDYVAVGRDPATIDQKINAQVEAEKNQLLTQATQHQTDAHSTIADITSKFLDAVDTVEPLNANIARGAVSAVGETVKQLGRLNQYNPASIALGDVAGMARSAGRQMQAGAAQQAAQTPQAQKVLDRALPDGRIKSTFETVMGTKPGFSRTVQQGIGQAGVEIPKMMATGSILKAWELPEAATLPALGALSGADEGLPGIIKGVGSGLVYHYGGAITGPYMSKVGNALLWIGAPAAEAHILNGVPLGEAIAQSLPMGAFAGFGGGERVNVRDASRPEGYRPARLRDIRRIAADPSLVVPPLDVRVKADEPPVQLYGPNQEPGGRPIVAERAETIAAQIDAMVNHRGSRAAVVIPSGEKGPTQIPKGYTATRTEAGLVIHSTEYPATDIQKIVQEGDTYLLEGHPNPDSEGPKRVVVARAGRDFTANGKLVKAGTELGSSYVDPDNESAAIDELRAQHEPAKPYFEVGGEQTAAQVVNERSGDVTQENPTENRPINTAQVPETEIPREPVAATGDLPEGQRRTDDGRIPAVDDRFKGLSNKDLEAHIAKARAQGEARLTKLAGRPAKGTPKETRQALPGRITKGRARLEQRMAEAQAELDRRRAGTDTAPSFDEWLQTEAGGRAGGIDPASISPEERATLQNQYDEQYYPRPHHITRQNRRRDRLVPGIEPLPTEVASQIPSENITKTITAPTDVPPWEQPTGDKLFATQTADQVVEPTADEAKAAQEPVVQVKPMERQNALRSYLGNKITMARAGAFDIIPQSWKGKWNRVVDVFGGSGLHGWQIGKALGKPVHYNELDPDVSAFQQLASTNEGQEKLRRVWGPIADEIGALQRKHPEGGTAALREVNDWWNATQRRLNRSDASPEEKGARVLMENTLGTMGNSQSLLDKAGKWKKSINALGEVGSLLDKHRINAQAWASTSNKRAEDLITETKPGDLVTLDPPYAQTAGYAVGNEHGSTSGAVNFIEKSVTPAAKRGVSIIYTNSAHVAIVEALRKAGLEVRIERVQNSLIGDKTAGGAGWRYEVVAWTKDVSPPRGTDPEVLKGLIAQDSRASQQDLSGKTGTELWNTYVRTAKESEAARAAEAIPEPVRRDPVEQARRNLAVERTRLIADAAKVLAKEHFSVKGEPVATERVLERHLTWANNHRHEFLAKLEPADRAVLEKEFPEFTAANIAEDIKAHTAAEPEPVQTETRAQDYKPQEGEYVTWQDGDKTRTGKVEKIMPSGRLKVRVSGKTDTARRVTLPAETEFQPHTQTVKTQIHVTGRPRLRPETDSLETAIRAMGGIKDDGSGELKALQQSGKPGLVTPDGMSPEAMTQALAEHGYGVGVFTGDQYGSGIDAAKMIDAATSDAHAAATNSQKGRHYSMERERDIGKEEEAYWMSQMDATERAAWEKESKFLAAPKVKRLLQEVADGKATAETYRQIREAGKARELTADDVAAHIRAAEPAKQPAEASVSRPADQAEPRAEAAGDNGRPLAPPVDDFVDPETGRERFAVRHTDERPERAMFHGTTAPDDVIRDGEIYLAPGESDARMFAENPVLSGQRGGESRVRSLQAKAGRAKDVSARVDEAVMGDEDVESIIKTLAVTARNEGYRYLEFDHPGATDQDFKATVALYPKEDIAVKRTPREVIETAGLKYLGEQQRPGGKPSGHMFNTPDNSTLMIIGDVTPETVAEKMAEHAAKPGVARFTRRSGEYMPEGPLVTRDQTRLTVNSRAIDLLKSTKVIGNDIEGITITRGMAELWADRLRRAAIENPTDGKAFRRLARQISIAANTEGSERIVIATPETMQHEAFHQAAEQDIADLREKHGQFDELTKHEAYPIARARLKATGYPDRSGIVVEEMAAHIAEGRHAVIGLTSDQAASFMDAWFRSFTRKNGDVSLKRFREMSVVAQQSLARAAAVSGEGVDRHSATLKPGADSALRDAKILRDLANSKAFQDQGLRGLDVPSQRMMVSRVLGAIGDFQVRNSIVRPVLVDVVNDLVRAEQSPNVTLHDKSVFKLALVRKGDGTISIRSDIADALIRVIARSSAKFSRLAKGTVEIGKLSPTEQTGSIGSRHDASPLNESIVSDESSRKLGSSSILPQEKVNEATQNTAYENARAAEEGSGRADAAVPAMEAGREGGRQTATRAFRRWFGDSKVVNEKGEPKVVYRGDFRADRLGNAFKLSRTTSGRFYFTEDPEIASQYSRDKPDHAHIEQNETYGDWFRFPSLRYSRERSEPNLSQAWYRLTSEQKTSVEKALRETRLDDQGDFVYGDGSIMDQSGLESYVARAHGNWLKAAEAVWLGSGAIYGEEPRFGEILKRAGLKFRYDNPSDPRSVVSPVHLAIKNPLDTGAIPAEVIETLRQVSSRDRSRGAKHGVDSWDKSTQTPKEFMQRLEQDLKDGTTYAWTTMPEKITNALQSMGYDGVKDVGGKNGGQKHAVWIAFDPKQIKSATGNRGTFDPENPNILFARKPGETDDQYEKRTYPALERLRAHLEARGQKMPEPSPRRSEAPTQPATSPSQADVANAPSTTLPPPRRQIPGERSFPKTAEAHGFTGGTDRDYTVLTNKASLERADRQIARLGMSVAAERLAQNQEPGAEGMATGILLIQRFEKAGQLDRAVAVANDLARKATKAGQEVQALAIITRLSPEGVLLAAQKRMKGGRLLPEETAKTVVAQAKEITAAEKLVADIQRQRPDIFGPNGEILPATTRLNETRDANARPVTRKQARARIGTLQDRLSKMEEQARARIAARAGTGASIQPFLGLNPKVAADVSDYAIIGATKLARKGIEKAVWFSEMANEVGLSSKTRAERKALRDLYRASYAEYEAQRKQFLQESRERGAEKQAGGPLDPQARQIVINERLDAMTAARKARTELARTFADLNLGVGRKAVRTAGDVWDLSRSAITSADISAGGRQAKMAAVPHPITFTRGLFRQFKALSKTQYERMISENQADPDYKLATRFKSDFFTSTATTKGGHEEVYQSEFAHKIPWIRHSEQMYNTMLDTVRLGWWKTQVKAMRKEGLDPENPEHKPLFELQADLISNFNGRGGGKLVRQVSPITNKLAFSTRFWASRLRVLTLPLDPRMYGKDLGPDKPAFSKATRVDAWKTLLGFYGLTASTLAIAKLTGAQVNLTNPDDPDWLKARWGKVHVDFSAGLQGHLRVAARLMKLLYMREFQNQKPRVGPRDIVEHYLRSKLAPNPALLYDLFGSDKKAVPNAGRGTGVTMRGTNVIGEPVYLTGVKGKGKIERVRTSALAQRAIPIVLQDALDAYQEGVPLKAAIPAMGASVFGEGVTTYQPTGKYAPVPPPRRATAAP